MPVAGKKPIRWDVPPSCESLMGYAMYLRDHQENLRQSFSQPSRSVQIPLGNGILVSMVLGPVVDFIRVRGPERKVVPGGARIRMVWDKLPPFEEGTNNIDLSKTTDSLEVSVGHYCTISVINGKDENGKELPARFSVKPGTDEDGVEYPGWSIEQGIRRDDGTYKVDGKSATLLLGGNVEGECDIIAEDGKTTLRKSVQVRLGLLYVRCYDPAGEPLFYGQITNELKLTGLFRTLADPFSAVVQMSLLEEATHDGGQSVYSPWSIYSHDGPWGMGPDGRFYYRWFFSEDETLTIDYRLTSTVKHGSDIVGGAYFGNRQYEYFIERVGAQLILEGDPTQPVVSQPIGSTYPGWQIVHDPIEVNSGDYGPFVKNIYLNAGSYYYELMSGRTGGLTELSAILNLGNLVSVTASDDYYYISLMRPDGDLTVNVYVLFINGSYAEKEISNGTKEATGFTYAGKQVMADYSMLYKRR
jgi:hypothetical protein